MNGIIRKSDICYIGYFEIETETSKLFWWIP